MALPVGNGQRTVCRTSSSHRSAGNVGASFRHHRRRVTLTAVALRRSYTGNRSGMTVAAWTLALPCCPGARTVALSTWHYGGPARSTPLRGRDNSPAVVIPIEAFNRGASRACADHRNSVRTMPMNKNRRSGQAPGLPLRNRSASYIGARQRPLYAALCVDARVRPEVPRLWRGRDASG